MSAEASFSTDTVHGASYPGAIHLLRNLRYGDIGRLTHSSLHFGYHSAAHPGFEREHMNMTRAALASIAAFFAYFAVDGLVLGCCRG
jgi:hypothetical protein